MNNQYKLYLTGFFIIIFLPLLAISPWFFPPEWGKAMAFRIIFSVISVLFVWQLTKDRLFFNQVRALYTSHKKTIWMLLVLSLLVIISTLFSQDILFSLFASPHRSGGAINFLFCFALALLLLFTLKDNDWNKLWITSFFVGDLVVLFGIVQYFDLLPNLFIAYEGRPPSTLSNPILLAIYLILLIFPLLSFSIEEKTKKRFFYWASLVLFLFGIFITGSRAAYLGLVIAGFYFIITFPKKLKKTKIATSCILILMVLSMAYISFAPHLPSFIENNARLSYVANRLSFTSIFEALGQTRFSAWKTFSKAIVEKPILGWGAENQSIAFDKYYDPSLNYLVKLGEDWWDRAHNIFLDMSLSYGIPFLILYLAFFIYLFIRLQKSKSLHPEKKFQAHALQAAFIGYFVALCFGFDSVTTYLTLFFLVGYALYLTSNSPENPQKEDSAIYQTLFRQRKIILGVLLVVAVFFLWQYALKPTYINGQINSAESSPCTTRLSSMDDILKSSSFLDSYVRLSYAQDVQACAASSDKEIDYIKKGIEALKEEAKIQPKYTRTWILLAQFNNTLLATAQDPATQSQLEKESLGYIEEAKKLSPLRQEIYGTEAGVYFAENDFPKMKQVAQECIKIDSNAGGCYWYLGLSEIMLKDEAQGAKDIAQAKAVGYEYNNEVVSLSQLAVAYSKINSYTNLISIYNRLLELDPKNINFRAALAFSYRQIGDYEHARKEALTILSQNPDARNDVQDFLNTLPAAYRNIPAGS